MIHVKETILAALLVLAVSSAGAAERKIVRLASLYWPPYTGWNLPDEGMSSKIVRAAFAESGYVVTFDYLPWRRALSLGLDGSQGHDGVLPIYTERAERDCIGSAQIGVSPIGFVENRFAGVRWASLSDLKGLRIGIMADYFNTPEFDAMVASGELNAQGLDREILGLRMVAQRRLDLALVDANVFAHLSSDAPDLRAFVRMNERLLKRKPLFVCFRPSAPERSATLRDAIDAGLAKLDVEAMQDQYVNR